MHIKFVKSNMFLNTQRNWVNPAVPVICIYLLIYKYYYYPLDYVYDFERTRWWLSQKRVVRTKLDIYVFIILNAGL
jgi:hypothetical protein